jgi:hypothetical protein
MRSLESLQSVVDLKRRRGKGLPTLKHKTKKRTNKRTQENTREHKRETRKHKRTNKKHKRTQEKTRESPLVDPTAQVILFNPVNDQILAVPDYSGPVNKTKY